MRAPVAPIAERSDVCPDLVAQHGAERRAVGAGPHDAASRASAVSAKATTPP